MKTTLITIIIFSFLLVSVFLFNNSLINLCDTITKNSEEIESLVKNKDWDNAYSNTQDIIDLIDKKTKLIAVYIHHRDLDDLMEEAVELSLYVDCEDYTEALVAVNSLENFAKNIKHLHKASMENIF